MKHPTPHSIAGLLAAGVLLAGCGGGSADQVIELVRRHRLVERLAVPEALR